MQKRVRAFRTAVILGLLGWSCGPASAGDMTLQKSHLGSELSLTQLKGSTLSKYEPFMKQDGIYVESLPPEERIVDEDPATGVAPSQGITVRISPGGWTPPGDVQAPDVDLSDFDTKEQGGLTLPLKSGK